MKRWWQSPSQGWHHGLWAACAPVLLAGFRLQDTRRQRGSWEHWQLPGICEHLADVDFPPFSYQRKRNVNKLTKNPKYHRFLSQPPALSLYFTLCPSAFCHIYSHRPYMSGRPSGDRAMLWHLSDTGRQPSWGGSVDRCPTLLTRAASKALSLQPGGR